MTSRNALTRYRTKEIKAKKGLPAEMHSQAIEQKEIKAKKG